MSKLYFCDIHSYGGNLPCPGCRGFQEGFAETYGSTLADCERLRAKVAELEEELIKAGDISWSTLARDNAKQVALNYYYMVALERIAKWGETHAITNSEIEAIATEALAHTIFLGE